MLRATLCCSVALLSGMLALCADLCSSQVVGVVTDAAGQPVPGAEVQLWSPTSLVVRGITNSAGSFSFDERISVDATLLLVRAIGFRPTEASLYPRRPSIQIVLREVATTLGLVVIKPARPCESRDDVAGRIVWETVRRRYEAIGDSTAVATGTRVFKGVVPESLLGVLDSSLLVSGQRGSTGRARAAWRLQVERSGYGWVPRGISYGTGLWEFVPLESDFAAHFVERLFGQLHRFGPIETSDDGLSTTFCPRSAKHPEIEGVLHFSSDTSLIGVEWAFTTPAPKETVGGRVTFAQPGSGALRSPLLPIAGLRWRQASNRRYEVKWQIYSGWVIDTRR